MAIFLRNKSLGHNFFKYILNLSLLDFYIFKVNTTNSQS